LADLQEDDRARTRVALEAAIFGNNRKRKRGEVEGGFDDEDMDEYEKRKQ